MNKQQIESFNAFQTRRRLRLKQREVAQAAILAPREPQVPPLTKNQIDRFMQRRLDHEAARRASIAEVFGKKKKLPLPVFSCENTESKQVRPRVVE